jgi:hypothetical protein
MSHTESPIPLVYIAGISFCGSTLLAIVLNSHPDVVSVGEMGPSERFGDAGYMCSCGRRIVECEFFAGVRIRMAEMGVDFDPGDMRLRHNYSVGQVVERLSYRTFSVPVLNTVRDAVRDALPPIHRRIDECARRNESFMRACLDVSGKKIFLDATKHADRIPFLTRMNVDLKVIHLVRDPRGFLHSARKYDETNAERAARDFVRGHDEIEFHLKKLPRERWTRVNYETLCSDPGPRFDELAAFMGAGPMRLPDDYRAQDYHVIGNRSRLRKDGRTQIRVDEKWRETLSRADLDTVAAIAGPRARRYGYSI